MKLLLSILAALLLAGCSETPKRHYDGHALLKRKCSACHNLDMPPKTYENETAPPMMAVVFHVRDFMKVDNPSEKREKFIAFVTDYALHPSAEKSFCDKESLASYGVMPSQKGNVTEEELEAIAAYMYDTYTKEAFLKKMEEAAAFARLPKGERLARREGCFGCHGLNERKVGPSFTEIAAKERDPDILAERIRSGSRGRWPESRNIPMPPMKDLNATALRQLSEWIADLHR
jgi:cytochrome c